MPIPSDITELIDRLNQELSQIEQDAGEGVSLIRLLLSQFPDNVRLIQFFSVLNNILLFAEISRRRIQMTIDRLSKSDVTLEEIQFSGEDLGTLLGQVIEVKIKVRRVMETLE
ncbi:hypothetical protein PCC7424_2192 [Gloeothece citriformis PCC 7424]|uniref:Restriction endonuclease subunit S n=1 Tax=Gloeothece citriformis (strain PCC 7424) TaxID=65393 RepID=B7KGE3_GLOC7|nr:hypothetical protein [Gloeothece citriformis]ACK70614.1 hypothetical protein PCC7424_2192 [Gloeothece citriformis PCC 7424]